MDPWSDTEFQRKFAQELERIGAVELRDAGFFTDGPTTPEQVLAALRATPSGAGSRALFTELKRTLDGR